MVKKSDDFFKKEISRREVEASAHYTFRDGFRLGLGLFVGVILGVSVLILVIYAINSAIRLFN